MQFLEKSECLTCQALTEVIDELSELLARSQHSRRVAMREVRLLRRLLVMDMEEQHSLANDATDDSQLT